MENYVWQKVLNKSSYENNINEYNERKRTGLGVTPLHAAASNGDYMVIEKLLEEGDDVDAEDGYGNTALMSALKGGHTEIAKFLIVKGADITLHNKYGQTPLHIAAISGDLKAIVILLDVADYINTVDGDGNTALCSTLQSGHTEVAKFLIAKGAAVTLCNRYKQAPLHFAAYSGNLQILHELLKKGADIDAVNGDGHTPLVEAIRNQHTETAQFLIGYGAEIMKICHRCGNTALHTAVIYENLVIIEILLENGADINALDKNGATPIMEANKMGNTEITKLLISKGANIHHVHKDFTLLHIASWNGYHSNAEILLKNGADVNAVDDSGYTPLLLAVEGRHMEIVKLLIANGADITIPNKYGKTPLHFAVLSGDLDVSKMLLDNVDARDDDGLTPLLLAIEERYTEIAKCLISKGAEVTTRFKDGKTLLHYACLYANHKVCKVLLKKGLDINAADDLGYTPLLCSVSGGFNGRTKIVKYLLYKGADIAVRSNTDQTALHVAENPKVAEILLKRGADINAVDKLRDTPLISAIKGKRTEMVKLLISKGADLTICNKERKNPVNAANSYGNQEICKMLLKERDFNVNENAPLLLNLLVYNERYSAFYLFVQKHLLSLLFFIFILFLQAKIGLNYPL